MHKYIDADELKKVFRDTEDAEYAQWTLAGVIGEIDNIEAADVEEVKHGRWDDKSVAFYLKCSECGCCVRAFSGEAFLDYAQEWNYCPNCGAKMDEVGE